MDTSDLKAFEEQLKNPNVTHVPQSVNQVPPTQNKIKVKKNIVLSHVCDATGCGYIRNYIPFSYSNAVFGKSQKILPIVSPSFIYQEDILMRTRTIFFQRQMNDQQLAVIKDYKTHKEAFQYFMAWDLDDYVFGKNELQGGTKEDGVPSYNFGAENITAGIKRNVVEIMDQMDVITASTDFMAECITKNLKNPKPVRVVYNTVPQYMWRTFEEKKITEKIKKPRVVWTGSPTHYSNHKRMLGDWGNAWKDWVIKNVIDNKIQFICFGGLPWFFEGIKDKIIVNNWLNMYQYPTSVLKQKADIGIAPLVPNYFNYCKSDIKYIEYCAAKILGIGTTFSNGMPSPYDNNEVSIPDNCTIEDIDDLVFNKCCEPDFYNSTIDKQYNMLHEKHRWTESPEFIKLFLESILKI